MEKKPEQLLNDQLAACLAATQDCLAHSRAGKADDTYGHQRHNELAYVAKLMKASARLTESLARLKGETSQNIHVTRASEGESRSARN
jgi:hypothetical protein